MRDDLADAVRQIVASLPRLVRVGTVTSTSPLEVNLAGQTGLSASRNSNYTPTLSDTVLVLQTETDLIIICKITSGG